MILPTPIIILGGKAGSGKDTVGTFIAENYNGVCIGQADPMKRFVWDLFGFTQEQLWGPSELRNAPVSFTPEQLSEIRNYRFESLGTRWIDSVVNFTPRGTSAFHRLENWFHRLLGDAPGNVLGGIDLSPRVALQTLGTSWGRSLRATMWNENTIADAKTLLGGGYSYTRTGGLAADEKSFYDYVITTDGRFKNEILNVRYLGGLALKIDRFAAGAEGPGIAGHQSERELDGIPAHFFSHVLQNDSSIENLFSKVATLMRAAYGDPRGFVTQP